MRFSVGSDHAGVSLRRAVVAHLRERGHEVDETGPSDGERVDYPDLAAEVAFAVASSIRGPGSPGGATASGALPRGSPGPASDSGEASRGGLVSPDVLGILICGTGIGVSIAANKVAGVRAALVHDPVTASLAAEHNAANILCLGARLLAEPYALSLIDTWLQASFEPRHAPRIAKIAALEQRSPVGRPGGS